MNSFSIKDFLLHILHGACITAVCIFVFLKLNDFTSCEIIFYTNKLKVANLAIFIGISYLLGLFIDALSDAIEWFLKFLGKPNPAYFFLFKQGKFLGLELAHYEKIRNNLIARAIDSCSNNNEPVKTSDKKSVRNYLEYISVNKETSSKEYLRCAKKVSNYLFQCAKSKAFSIASVYQIDHIESFYRLYIFFRNLVLTIIISVMMLLFIYKWYVIIIGIILLTLSILFSLRYFCYYARIVLGTTYSSTPVTHTTEKVFWGGKKTITTWVENSPTPPNKE